MTVFNRRTMIGCLLGAVSAVAAVPAWAFSANEARGLVDRLVGDINKVIGSGKSEKAMYSDFTRIFARYSDTKYIAAVALGADARRASPAQKKAFSKAFGDYIGRKYGKRFREFIGGRIETKSVKPAKKSFWVQTTAHLRGESPFAVDFRVSDRTGKLLFLDMKIEGISMLLTEKTEVGAMLDRRGGNIDRLIADLKKAG